MLIVVFVFAFVPTVILQKKSGSISVTDTNIFVFVFVFVFVFMFVFVTAKHHCHITSLLITLEGNEDLTEELFQTNTFRTSNLTVPYISEEWNLLKTA